MHIKQHARLTKAVAPALEPGELAQLTGRARVTTVPTGTLGKAAAVARENSRSANRAEAFLVLTDRRLLVLETSMMSRPTSKVRRAIPRDALSLLRFKRGVVSTIDLALENDEDGVRLRFPRPDRQVADELAALFDVEPV
ncbi:hypothetical protein ACPPVT_00300 [Angustibacter sp. McL0619]|uniref:hypothetical protein n=1 Tax=Angustibacter sp. McL0619 TaxID=3415676 RepID=UPI003CF3176E